MGRATAKAEVKARGSSRASASSAARWATRRKMCKSKETSAFLVDEEGLAHRVECAGDRVIAVARRRRMLRIGVDSCAAVAVVPKTVAEYYPVLQTRGNAKSYRPASGKLLPDLGSRKVQVKLKDWPPSVREPADGGHAQSTDGGVGDERHRSRRVLPQERQGHQGLRVPRVAAARRWSSRE